MQLIWFKKDLRVKDHQPLFEATKCGPCLCVYIYEPEIIESAEYHSSHHDFLNQSLRSLDESLRQLGGRLITRVGEAVQVFSQLLVEYPFEAIWSHEETGNAISYARDLRVGRWTKAQQIQWNEFAQTGVIRRLANRDGWSRRRNQMMGGTVVPIPEKIDFAETVEPATLDLRHVKDFKLDRPIRLSI